MTLVISDNSWLHIYFISGRNCWAYGGRGEVRRGVWWGNLWETDHLEVPGVDGRIIFKWIFIKWDEGRDWIILAQNRYIWQALVNVVMNLQVS